MDMGRNLVSFYLQVDHPVTGHFDADLFLDDLLEGKTNFCSCLLVNSLLLWACVSKISKITLLALLTSWIIARVLDS